MSTYKVTLQYEVPEVYQLQLEADAGGRIKAVSITSGFAHRAICQAIRDRYRNPNAALYAVERICGICSHSHALVFCQALEIALGIEVPPRAAFIRAIVAELERLQSHLLNLTEVAVESNAKGVAERLWEIRAEVTRWLLLLTGNRMHYGINCIGGVTRDLGEEGQHLIQKGLPRLNTMITQAECSFKRIIRPRLENLGIWVPPVQLLCGSGPNLRASGWSRDVRRDTPYAAYKMVSFTPPVREEGDAWARVWIRLKELESSCGIIEQLLQTFPDGEIVSEDFVIPRKAVEVTTSVEAPRGENRYTLRLSPDGAIKDINIQVPTTRSVEGLKEALIGEHVDSVGLIVSSFDLCMSCLDGP